MKRLYMNKQWLKNKIHKEKKNYDEIAALCNVSYRTIKRYALKFSIGIGRAKGKPKKFKRTPIIKPIKGEIWKPCEVIHKDKLIKFNDYMVSNHGRIKRITPDRNSSNQTWIGKECKTKLNKDGYHRLTLSYYDGITRKQIVAYVARLVANAFLGLCPDGMEVNHKNGNKNINKPYNLEYLTKDKNKEHAIENGLIHKGSECNNSKLNERKVYAIRKLFKRKNKPKYVDVARKFKVHPSRISSIVLYPDKEWKHVRI